MGLGALSSLPSPNFVLCVIDIYQDHREPLSSAVPFGYVWCDSMFRPLRRRLTDSW